MEMLENKGTQKRRMPRAGKILLAAALAVGCVLSIAAGLPAQVYNFVSGGQVTYMPGTASSAMTIGGETAPIQLKDGRLWFEADGQKADVTDLIDADTPYIHERTDPATGEKGYVVVGGTVEDFGWAEFYAADGGIGSIVGENFADSLVTLPDGSKVSFFDLTEEQREELSSTNEPGMDGFIVTDYVIQPWYEAALEQLGFEA